MKLNDWLKSTGKWVKIRGMNWNTYRIEDWDIFIID